MGARPPPPLSHARQQGPPRSRARANPEREEAARGTGADSSLASPTPLPLSPFPLASGSPSTPWDENMLYVLAKFLSIH